MSFIQCKDEKELEAVLAQKKQGFVSDDHRIYDKITFADDQCYYELDAEMLLALHDLQVNIEFSSDERSAEMAFTTLERDAKALTDSFKKVQALLGEKRLKKVQK